MSNKVLITKSQKAVKVPSGLRILIRAKRKRLFFCSSACPAQSVIPNKITLCR